MTVKDWLANTINIHTYKTSNLGLNIPIDRNYEIQEIRPRLYCNDGYSISVQASAFHYCYPRLNGAKNYESVELGFPSMEDELINEYAEGLDYTETVYGYVPIEIVEKLIEKHGGIKT